MTQLHPEQSMPAWRLSLAPAIGAAILIAGSVPVYAHDGAVDHLHVAQGPASAPASAPASQPHHADTHQQHMEHAAAFHGLSHAIAILQPTAGNTAHGVVHFMRMGDGVHVTAHVSGLEPNSTHGFHVHEFGDCSADTGKSAGGHYNPAGVAHALPGTTDRHAGDLGNLTADANGEAKYERRLMNVSIAGRKTPIIGRGVIVHAKPDDGGQPTGNAGARLACGTIGIAKPAM